MKENEMRVHPLYKKAKRSYYFERWKWVGWNAFMTFTFLIRLGRDFNNFDMLLCILCALVTIFLLTVIPKTKFEDSQECEVIRQQLR